MHAFGACSLFFLTIHRGEWCSQRIPSDLGDWFSGGCFVRRPLEGLNGSFCLSHMIVLAGSSIWIKKSAVNMPFGASAPGILSLPTWFPFSFPYIGRPLVKKKTRQHRTEMSSRRVCEFSEVRTRLKEASR